MAVTSGTRMERREEGASPLGPAQRYPMRQTIDIGSLSQMCQSLSIDLRSPSDPCKRCPDPGKDHLARHRQEAFLVQNLSKAFYGTGSWYLQRQTNHRTLSSRDSLG